MRMSEIQQFFARDIVRLLLEMEKQGFKYTFGEAMRSPEQAEIYAKSGKGICNSLHCQRLAIDINLFNEKGEFLDKSSDHAPFGKFWESLNPTNRWGGNFKERADGNHYERNDRQSI